MNDAQAKYLVHVKPPGDLLVDSIRKVIDESNITNAAIVFDGFFGRNNAWLNLSWVQKSSQKKGNDKKQIYPFSSGLTDL